MIQQTDKDNGVIQRQPGSENNVTREETLFKENSLEKPLLLWLQGGPEKSSLFGQFLENGALGIDASGKLYYRNHTVIKRMNVIYLDQPAGSGYSLDENQNYPGTLEKQDQQSERPTNC
ncbi:hypothetical protein V5799_020145 [Amblyomma americanum]|uniref:Uncharacterized protein n=1 Tax=Amblyomma americanum TaxID=6943 RepID=A0AAQ4EUL5_AMBAM